MPTNIPNQLAAGIEHRNRASLTALHRGIAGPFSADDAARLLSMPRPRATRLLRYLATRGWLSRVRRGLYVTVPLDASDPSNWREDPWIVASRVFGPCYVGGWTALQHWSLTEQLFRDTLVITSRPVRTRQVEVQGARYYLKHLPAPRHFGLRFVWRENVRVEVSDPSRTIIDVLDDPGIGGGVRHVAGALAAYWASEHLREHDILAYAERLGNRSVYKRLGFLLETLRIEAPEVLEACERRRSSGLTSLDPSIHREGRITKRWNLRVNVDLTERVEP